ncbi:MAG: hypothetical protein KDI09_03375 [Halioglobus sp.]|nr:hypothetical protein [Halioglobus sp.]
MLNKIVNTLAILASALLLVSGLRWLVDPEGAAAGLGMPLLDGIARSTQIGDLMAFFIVAGAFGLVGIMRDIPSLLYTPAALVGAAALFRILATVVHDATLATQMIAVEAIMLVIFVAAARRVGHQG